MFPFSSTCAEKLQNTQKMEHPPLGHSKGGNREFSSWTHVIANAITAYTNFPVLAAAKKPSETISFSLLFFSPEYYICHFASPQQLEKSPKLFCANSSI